jgi:hypothetical protein
MVGRALFLICLAVAFNKGVIAQSNVCTFKPPFYLMHFGRGNVQDVNTSSLALYNRVFYTCPGDGHYTYASAIPDCFNGDWHALSEDHTPGDVDGNMLVVNSAYDSGPFLVTKVKGFKGGTTYQFGAWLMNLCKPTKKCPSIILPSLLIRLQTPSGKTVAQFLTGELPRVESPHWTQHRAQFTMPAAETELALTFIDNAPGGCGNDFALDDISFSECVKIDPAKVVEEKKMPLVAVKKQPPVKRKEEKKDVPLQVPVNRNSSLATIPKIEQKLPLNEKPVLTSQSVSLVPVPTVLKERTNTLARQIETGVGEIQLDLYDNGEIDGDTVSIYHNNVLIISEQRLSHKPITFRIQVDKDHPHHELVMVANNLGSIPPNTSMMIVTTKDKRYQVFISSTEQQNAKVVIDLRE